MKRELLFLLGCIPSRLLFAYLSKTLDPKYLPYFAMIATLPMLGWLYIYFIAPRTTGPEVFGDKIWWNDLRIVHALLYLLFIIYAVQKKAFSYIVLIIDALVGLIAFTLFHTKMVTYI
uniref:Uncharacterized protein n=1 Tax=Pyramimonas orientalis virus TaxID=455367 RepID=A0A7L9AXV1_POV01|nr:hypothetical protein HWQ62_00333 [Pyramimonas orientalis virus]